MHSRLFRAVLALTGLAALGFGGCQRANPVVGSAPVASLPPLRIAAASDLDHVLPRLARRFQEHTQITTTLTLDASGRLAEQIKAGAPFDLFMAANVKFVQDLADAGLVDPRSVQPYARGMLVLCVNNFVGERVRALPDLLRAEIGKIAIAHPDYAPYGAAAKQALERVGLWAKVEPKIVRAPSVRQAMSYVQSGDADVALVSRAQADAAEVRSVVVDSALYDPLLQALGIVSTSSQRDRADEFARFILGPEGQQILRDAGFEKPTLSSEPTTPAANHGSPPKK
jgi:molybdate transport system substrate-binding protein